MDSLPRSPERRWLRGGLLVSVVIHGLIATRAGAEPVIPDTPVGQRLRWAIQAAQPGARIEPVGVFARSFLEHVPSQVLVDAIDEVATKTGGSRLTSIETKSRFSVRAALRARTDDACWRLEVEVAEEPPHGITRIYYQFDPVLGVREGDGWPEITALFEHLGGTAALTVHGVQGAHLEPMVELNADVVLAIGSTFKLWVLGALAEDVVAGEASWTQPLAIRDAWKSLPSGTTQDLPEGETRTLAELASLMISISDNTATDHLIHSLGRDRVIEFARAHGSPRHRNVPFLTTGEVFRLKITADDDLRERYVGARKRKRKKLLEREVAQLPLPADASLPEMPLAIDEIEYFASCNAMARFMASLDSLSTTPATRPAWDALTLNRGFDWDDTTWPVVAYKGGSEPGVLHGVWLARRADGRRFALCFGVNDPAAPVDADRVVRILKGAVALLENE